MCSFFILFFSCSDLISQFHDLLTLATDPMVKLQFEPLLLKVWFTESATLATPESIRNADSKMPLSMLSLWDICTCCSLCLQRLILQLFACFTPSLHSGLCSNVICQKKPFLTNLPGVAFLLHSVPLPYFTFFKYYHHFTLFYMYSFFLISFHKYFCNPTMCQAQF